LWIGNVNNDFLSVSLVSGGVKTFKVLKTLKVWIVKIRPDFCSILPVPGCSILRQQRQIEPDLALTDGQDEAVADLRLTVADGGGNRAENFKRNSELLPAANRLISVNSLFVSVQPIGQSA